VVERQLAGAEAGDPQASAAIDRRYTGGKGRNSLVFRRLLRIPGLGAGISRLREAVSNLLPEISGLRVAISDQSEAVSGV
jgi:hypothetical protein